MENEKKSNNLFADAIAEAIFLDMMSSACPKRHKPTVDEATAIHTEAVVDFDHVCIPTTRFEDLVRAESELRIIRKAYHQLKNWQVVDMLSIVFGPKPKEGVDGAQ